MATVTIRSDFGAQHNKICHCLHSFPIYLPWNHGTGCHEHSKLDFYRVLKNWKWIVHHKYSFHWIFIFGRFVNYRINLLILILRLYFKFILLSIFNVNLLNNLFFLNFLLFIRVWLINNVLIVSGGLQRHSAIHRPISILNKG